MASTLPDYLGFLDVGPIHRSLPETTVAAGGLVSIRPDLVLPAPADPTTAPLGALTSVLGGFSFTMDGQTMPLRSYQNGAFVAQIPWEIAPGRSHMIDEWDAAGHHLATRTGITVSSVAPAYREVSAGIARAWKTDGSVVDEANPLAPGETIVLKLTGQGPVNPAVSNGLGAGAGQPSIPTAPVTVLVGNKQAGSVSAAMSTAEAGVLEVRAQTPPMADGDYTVRVRVGVQDTDDLPIRVAAVPRTPKLSAGSVVSAASYFNSVAPGSLFTIFGTDLAAGVAQAEKVPLPTRLNGVSVTVAGVQAPLLYVSPGQINGQIPYEAPAGGNVPVVVNANGASSAAVMVQVQAAAPGNFQYGQNRSVVQNQDYKTNAADNPAEAGSVAIAYLTGAGATDFPVATGATAPLDRLVRPLVAVTASLNGVPCDVAFAGLTPGLVGVLQVNFRVPSLPAGSYPLVVTMNGVMSNSALVSVR